MSLHFLFCVSATVSVWKRYSIRLDPKLFVRGLMSYLCHSCLFTYCDIQHIMTKWVTWRVSYMRQEVITHLLRLALPQICGGVRLAHFVFSFLCFDVFLCFVCLLSVRILGAQCCQFFWIVHSWIPLRVSLTFILKLLYYISHAVKKTWARENLKLKN